MKTKKQIEAKLAEHESKIEKEFKQQDIDWDYLKRLRHGRQALLWVLSNEELIGSDDITKQIDFEILCHESTNLF